MPALVLGQERLVFEGEHALIPAWLDLIQHVLDDRTVGWDPDEPPRTGSVEATIAFAEYAKERAANSLQ